MPLEISNINHLWGSLLVEEIIRNGVDYFCLSPGSRSTPLAVAVARHPHAHSVVWFDERGAAFHALGYARARTKPAVLICTSGTAAANYYPAVIEAAIDHLPLVILTADRPPELQETGANQTIRQSRLFGAYAKWSLDLPCPDTAIAASMLLSSIDQALYQARAGAPGPVHLNCPFREPLAPVPQPIDGAYLEPLAAWQEERRPFTCYLPSASQPQPEVTPAISEVLGATSRGIIIVGRLGSAGKQHAVRRLLAHLQWPVFADVASGLRPGDRDVPLVPSFDQLLLSSPFRATHRPATVLHLGGEIVSQRVLDYIAQLPRPHHHILVKDHPFRYDPCHTLTHHVETDMERFCEAVVESLPRQGVSAWTQGFLDRSAAIDAVLTDFTAASHALNEIAVARSVSQWLPADHGLWLGNSMPVRDMNNYASACSAQEFLQVGINRGASGIDGTLASASGFAVGLGKPVTLIVGDLALIHDLNSLGLLARCSLPVIVIVINNHGGGIFSLLPIAAFADVFEPYFATPHEVNFAAAADLFGLSYAQPETMTEFHIAYRTALSAGRASMIEIVTDRQQNAHLHRRLQREVRARLERDFPC